MSEEMIGTVSDFFAHPVVAGIELTGALKVGDKIRIKGHTTELSMTVDSMQIDNAAVTEAKAGDSIGAEGQPPTPDRKASEFTSRVNSKTSKLTSGINSGAGEKRGQGI